MQLLTNNRPNNPKLVNELASINYRPCPHWLGDFSFQGYPFPGQRSRWYRKELPPLARAEAQTLAQLVPNQVFNTVFIQRYEDGQNVFKHRDPRNNVGHTVIATYGDYSCPPVTRLWSPDHSFQQQAGDVLVLPCTIDNRQGPYHEVTWMRPSTGTRYAIILNTIR